MAADAAEDDVLGAFGGSLLICYAGSQSVVVAGNGQILPTVLASPMLSDAPEAGIQCMPQ